MRIQAAGALPMTSSERREIVAGGGWRERSAVRQWRAYRLGRVLLFGLFFVVPLGFGLQNDGDLGGLRWLGNCALMVYAVLLVRWVILRVTEQRMSGTEHYRLGDRMVAPLMENSTAGDSTEDEKTDGDGSVDGEAQPKDGEPVSGNGN